MALEIQSATPADAPALAEVFFAAFSDDFNRTMFPPTPDVRAWIAETLLTSDEASGRDIILKATDPADSDAVVAFAKWVRPSSSDAHADPDRHEGPKWPEGSDAALCDLFFGTMDEHHGVLMGEKPHYYLEILGVHPAYQGRGLASKLLKWALQRADEEGVEVYLSSSPEGRPMYEKNGFQGKNSFSPFAGYVQVNMIRPVQK